jgi:hypothetical protein
MSQLSVKANTLPNVSRERITEMLPAFMNAPRLTASRLNATRKFVALGTAAAVISAMAAPPAMAWGAKEQGFVAGVASTLLVTTLVNPTWYYKKPAPVAQQPVQTPIYYTPAPTYTSTIYSSPAATAFNSYQPSQRRDIQSKLAAQGYYHSTIDGAFGPNTYNAVQAYANATGKPSLLSTQAGAFTIYDGLIY